MNTPKSEFDKILKSINNLENQDKGDTTFWDAVAFVVAQDIAEYEDPALLEKLPSWISEKVYEMREIYMKQKNYIIYSSIGVTDHTEMMRKLVKLLPPKDS